MLFVNRKLASSFKQRNINAMNVYIFFFIITVELRDIKKNVPNAFYMHVYKKQHLFNHNEQ